MSFKDRILDKAESMFTRFGLRSVTMDDIARDLCISKKTIYECIKDKKELVLLSITKNVLDHKRECQVIFEETSHPIDQMLEIFNVMHKRMDEVNPSVFLDLKKSYPIAFKKFNSFREDFIFNKIKQNLIEGVKLELYRDDFDVELIAQFYITIIDFILSPDTGEDPQVVHKQYELMNYHLRGIVTEKGLTYLKNNPLNHGIKV